MSSSVKVPGSIPSTGALPSPRRPAVNSTPVQSCALRNSVIRWMSTGSRSLTCSNMVWPLLAITTSSEPLLALSPTLISSAARFTPKVIRLGKPVDDHVRLQLRQDIVAQHALGPGDRGIVRCCRAAPSRGRAEALEHRVVDFERERRAHAWFPIPVDQDANPLGGARVEQQYLTGRPRAHR